MSQDEITPARLRELLATAEDYEREHRLDALTYDGALGLALLRTLAAREALLERAGKYLMADVDARARALAAEIADALGERNDD